MRGKCERVLSAHSFPRQFIGKGTGRKEGKIPHKLASVIDVQRLTVVFQCAAVVAEPIKGTSVVYNLTRGEQGAVSTGHRGIMIWEFSGFTALV